MKKNELVEWLNSLPAEFDDFNVLTGEVCKVDDQLLYRPMDLVILSALDEETKTIILAVKSDYIPMDSEIGAVEDESPV